MAQSQEHKYMEIAMDENGMWGDHSTDSRQAPRLEDRTVLQECIESPAFQMTIGVVIACNAAVIGFETDNPDYWMWPVLEDVFLITFTCELSMRVWAWGLTGFFNSSGSEYHWNVFDFTMVSLGVMDRSFAVIFAEQGQAERLQVGQTRFVSMLMRSFRLLRILRIFRIFRVLKHLYLLAMGFFDAVASVLWVTLLCALILYICAIMLTRLVGKPSAADPLGPFKEQYFGSIPRSMLTLFQIMAYPDMEKFKAIYHESFAMQCFLVFFIVFGAFTTVSVLTGVISESMFEKSKARQEERRIERERARTVFIRSARKVLQEHDEEGNGFLTRGQFNRCKDEVMGLCEHQSMDVRAKDLDAMFELVDYESSNTIEIEELLYGMVQLSADVRPMSIMELRRIVVRGLHGVNQHVAALDGRLQQLDARLGEVLEALRPPAPAAEPAGQGQAPLLALGPSPAPLPPPPGPGPALAAA